MDKETVLVLFGVFGTIFSVGAAFLGTHSSRKHTLGVVAVTAVVSAVAFGLLQFLPDEEKFRYSLARLFNAEGASCFSEGGNLFTGKWERPFFTEVVQCKHTTADLNKPLVYEFPLSLPDNGVVNGFRGEFVIDEGGEAKHSGAIVQWKVKYGDEVLCTVSAKWRKPGTCVPEGEIAATPGSKIRVEQRLTTRGRSSSPIFAGIYKPMLIVNQPSD